MQRIVCIACAALLALAPSLALSQEGIIGGGVFGGAAGTPYSGPVIKQPMMTMLYSPSDSATDYYVPVSAGEGGASAGTAPGGAGALIGAAGTISNLTCYGSGVTAYAGNWTFTIYHSTGGLNGTFNSTSVSCAVGANGAPYSSTNSFSVAQGDAISIQSAPPATQGSTGVFNISFLFTAASGAGFLWTSGAGGSPTAGNFYPVNGFLTAAGNGTEVNISSLLPAGGTISNLVFGVKTTPASGDSWTATVNHETAGNCSAGASPTSLSATISNGQYTEYDKNSGHAFTVAQNDCLSIAFSSVGSPSIGQWSVGLQWTPVNVGEYPLMESAPAAPAATASATRYLTLAGNIAAGGSSTETERYQYITPATGGSYSYSTFTAQDLSYLQNTTIGGAGRSAFTLRVAGASQCPAFSSSALTSSVSGGNTAGSCSGGAGNSGTIPGESLIDALTTMGSSNGNTATWSKTSIGVVLQ